MLQQQYQIQTSCLEGLLLSDIGKAGQLLLISDAAQPRYRKWQVLFREKPPDILCIFASKNKSVSLRYQISYGLHFTDYLRLEICR